MASANRTRPIRIIDIILNLLTVLKVQFVIHQSIPNLILQTARIKYNGSAAKIN